MCLGATEVNQDSVDSLLTLGLGDYSGQPPPQYHHPHAQHSSFQCKDECSQGGEILRNKTAEYFRLCSFGLGGWRERHNCQCVPCTSVHVRMWHTVHVCVCVRVLRRRRFLLRGVHVMLQSCSLGDRHHTFRTCSPLLLGSTFDGGALPVCHQGCEEPDYSREDYRLAGQQQGSLHCPRRYVQDRWNVSGLAAHFECS